MYPTEITEPCRQDLVQAGVTELRTTSEVDEAITEWTRARPAQNVVETLDDAGVPVGPIQSVADILADPHVRSRDVLETLEWEGRPLRVPAPGPRLSEAPGRTDRVGGEIGTDTDAVLREVLGLDEQTLAGLHARGVIAGSGRDRSG